MCTHEQRHGAPVCRGRASLVCFNYVWLCDAKDCSPPGSSVHGILQASILEWVAMPSSRGSSQARDRPLLSPAVADRFFTTSATWGEALIPYSASCLSLSWATIVLSWLHMKIYWHFCQYKRFLLEPYQGDCACQVWFRPDHYCFFSNACLGPPRVANYPDAGKDWRQEEKGTTEHEMVGWHHRPDGQWVCASSGSWWCTGKPGVLQSMGLQRVRQSLAAEQQQQSVQPSFESFWAKAVCDYIGHTYKACPSQKLRWELKRDRRVYFFLFPLPLSIPLLAMIHQMWPPLKEHCYANCLRQWHFNSSLWGRGMRSHSTSEG